MSKVVHLSLAITAFRLGMVWGFGLIWVVVAQTQALQSQLSNIANYMI